MKNPLRRLFPRSHEHLLMGRVGSSAMPETEAAGVQTVAIRTADDPRVGKLDAFAVANGFPQGWVQEMLAEGASAVAALDLAGVMMAMGWMTERRFRVEEIEATLDPGAGVYLFGDFVAPALRGRKLQQLLVAQRLRGIEGAAFACTLVEPSNAASVRSYEKEGFVSEARFTRYHWRGRTWSRCRGIRHGPGVAFALNGADTIIAQARRG
jgi:ribosomal protein S18 acetylase RimI-like enzyme